MDKLDKNLTERGIPEAIHVIEEMKNVWGLILSGAEPTQTNS